MACGLTFPFPKVIGGNGGDTFITQMAASNSYLVAAGTTKDSLLRQFTSGAMTPFVILFGPTPNYHHLWSRSINRAGFSSQNLAISSDSLLVVLVIVDTSGAVNS